MLDYRKNNETLVLINSILSDTCCISIIWVLDLVWLFWYLSDYIFWHVSYRMTTNILVMKYFIGAPLLFVSLMLQVCWDLQVSRRQVYLHSDTICLSVSVLVIVFGLICSKEFFSLLLCSGGCWYVDHCSVLAVGPFATQTLLDPSWCPLLIFFVTWFRFAELRSCWVLIWVGLIRVGPLYMFTMYSC
jgi:hypothetical protein